MNKVLVTGGGGFIGLALTRRLLERGRQVAVFGRHRYPEVEALGGRCLVGDLRDPAALALACAGRDTVFHVAARAGIWGSRASYWSINRDGSANVVAACRGAGVSRLIHTSTPSVVFNGGDLAGVDERTPYAERVLCHYAASKIAAEKLVLEADCRELRTCALRPHLVWGPGDTNLIPRLIQRGREGSLRIVGQGDNLVDIAYIDNVVDAHLLAAENLEGPASAGGRAFFISQGEPVRLWDWINDLYGRLGIKPVGQRIGFGVAYAVGALMEAGHGLLRIPEEPRMTRFLAEQLAKSHWFSIENAHMILGYRPHVSTEEGMERLVDWLREFGEFGGTIPN